MSADASLSSDRQMKALADYLREHRDALLATWRRAVRDDPALTTGASLPRAQLDDHVPGLLRAFERRLDPSVHEERGEQNTEAAAHGLHRWQQGYDLREVARELGRLNECMTGVLSSDGVAELECSPSVMADARLLWAKSCSISIGESVDQYQRLQQAEAGSHIRALETALVTLRELEKQRADLWHEAAHDLRGNVGVVANVAAGLSAPTVTDAHRNAYLGMLARNVSSLRELLDDVTNLARLQAGREICANRAFDVAELLHGLCAGLQRYVDGRKLTLSAEGPSPFMVMGDATKILRLAQNLTMNALKYTPGGSVTVSWGTSELDDRKRWMLTVVDTGPGFELGPSSPVAGALEQATGLAHQAHDDAKAGVVTPAEDLHATAPPSALQQSGEGIGLSIVKRLAELMNASIEVESALGSGTTFRVFFPYDSPPEQLGT